MPTTFIDIPEEATAGAAFDTPANESSAFTYEGDSEPTTSESNAMPSGITAEQLQAIIAQSTASSQSREQILLEALQALKGKQEPEKQEDFGIKLAELLSQEEAASLGDLGASAVGKAVNASVAKISQNYEQRIAAMDNQLKLMQKQLQAKFVEDFRKDGGDILDTPQGKTFMQEIDPNIGITRAEAAERLGRVYLDNQVKLANQKYKKPPAVQNGGGAGQAISASTALKKVETELAAIRAKPQSQLTTADSARRSELWAQFMRLSTKTEGS